MKIEKPIKSFRPTFATGMTIALSLLLGAITASPGQNHSPIQAIGQVSNGGALVTSANTVNGTVTSANTATGDYTVTITAPGAFAGAVSDDFLIEVTVEDFGSDDEVAKATVNSVTPDELEIRVRIADVEDASNGNIAEARNSSFFFTIYRISSPVMNYPGETKFLHALGTVDDDGTLLSQLAVDDISVASNRTAEGEYEIVLSKPGAFTDDVGSDYVIILSTIRAAVLEDEVIRGGIGVLGTSSDHEVVIRVFTDDAQTAADASIPVPDDQKFAFNIYKIPGGAGSGLAQSRLLTAAAKVNGSNGNLISGTNFIKGGSPIQTARTGEGEYTVLVHSPGAFADMQDNQYVVQVHINQGGNADESVSAEAFKNDDDSLMIEVATNDVEQTGTNAGQLTDTNFFCLVYDTRVRPQPDLKIGPKKSLSKQKGNNRYNHSGAGQKTKVGLIGTSKRKYHLTLENDGNFSDNISLKANRSGGKIKMKYFQTTGGRKNVTARVLTGTHVAEDVRPGKMIRYEAQAKYQNLLLRPRKTLRYTARSKKETSQIDVNKAKIVPK